MRVSFHAERFGDSVIRKMTRLAEQYGAINLAQGFPDYDPPELLLQAAIEAVRGSYNQYSTTYGSIELRTAIAGHYSHLGLSVDPEAEVTITCGATEALVATLLALVNPGDEVILFEPFYENYVPAIAFAGAFPRFVRLRPPEDPDGVWHFDEADLRAAVTSRTKAMILNTPHNPTGKVFSLEELKSIAELATESGIWLITDEIYEHIVYTRPHVRVATLPGLYDHTVTVSGASKTFAATGWRIGWILASKPATEAIRKIHDFLTVCAPTPFQEAVAKGFLKEQAYIKNLSFDYARKRDLLLSGVRQAGFRAYAPEGAYYILADVSPWSHNDVAFSETLLKDAGVAVVPGSSFYSETPDAPMVRFAFAKKPSTLAEAIRRLDQHL